MQNCSPETFFSLSTWRVADDPRFRCLVLFMFLFLFAFAFPFCFFVGGRVCPSCFPLCLLIPLSHSPPYRMGLLDFSSWHPSPLLFSSPLLLLLLPARYWRIQKAEGLLESPSPNTRDFFLELLQTRGITSCSNIYRKFLLETNLRYTTIKVLAATFIENFSWKPILGTQR